MSTIQVTNEISVQLGRLRAAVNAAVSVSKAQQLTFADNDFSALTEFENAIQKTGGLMERYQATLDRDICSCEEIVENARARDRMIAQEMMMF